MLEFHNESNKKLDLESQSSTSQKVFNLTLRKFLEISTFGFILYVISSWELSALFQYHGLSKNDYDFSSSILLQSLKTNYAGKWLKDYTEDNQLAGTNFRMVNYTLNRFIELGLEDSYIDEYTSYISYPLEQSLKLIHNDSVAYTPSLIEDELKEDPTSSYHVPAFLGYAPSGNVTAEYVYCNFGRFEDFQKLIELGVNLRGKIAIVRYGAIYRGLKVKFAQDHGMSAVLIYTDTYDDGEVTVENGYKPYPDGFARNPSAIQRGSALFLSIYPGDPTTPGYAIKPGEDKARGTPYNTIPQIPALPISYKEVAPILKQLSGQGPKVEGWKGLVDGYDYSVGPNPNYKLNLYNNQEFNISTMHNIMGKIKGYDDSKFVLIGNHHDSWTPAAADPHSGSSTMLEIIRAFGDLTKTGWKPRVSIVFASWDGEEYALLGSTEYAEYYEHALKKKCIAYINTDVSTTGSILSLKASPLLNDVLLTSARELQYPNSSITLYDHFLKKQGKIGTLGSGSDYTAFLEHLGIPSADIGFKNDLKSSAVYQYHSLYDSYYWMSKFGDPGFIFHNLAAKLMSLVVLHLSDDPVLKLRTHDYSLGLSSYFNGLEIPEKWTKESDHCNKKSRHHLELLLDEIQDNLTLLEIKSLDFDAELEKLAEMHKNWDSLSYFQKIKLHFRTKGVNSILQYYERHLLDEEGLKDRPWFKHSVYASGRYTGYKGQELPGLAEAIEDDNMKDFIHRSRKLNMILKTLIRMSSL